ncbi:MAG: quinone-dependent dihydroorotate dehydrogenase, partial [Bacteroidota bacterium]
NRMGFNNEGVDKVVERLKKRRSTIIVGGNIGKNKVTSNEKAIEDYIICYRKLFPHVDYFVVNVSSPNTPGLRELQEKGPLLELLRTLKEENNKQEVPKPILLKIAPDLSSTQVDDILDITASTRLDGLILSNTTIDRDDLKTSDAKVQHIGAGGLSGTPLLEKSTALLKYVRSKNKEIPIIAVGGILSPEDAMQKLEAGADLIQIYTGLVYRGPALIKNINKRIINSFERT